MYIKYTQSNCFLVNIGNRGNKQTKNGGREGPATSVKVKVVDGPF